MVSFFKRLARNRKGASLVEYAILVAGVALVSLVAVTVLGHKTSDLIGTMAAILPGGESADSGPIVSGQLIETTNDGSGITLNPLPAASLDSGDRLDQNLAITPGSASDSTLVLPAPTK